MPTSAPSTGVAINHKDTSTAYAFAYRTREFPGQISAQIFGTISLNVTY
jgi:hypothetical protein